MTELYIDKRPVVLPKNFSLEFTAENPFFTKNGKHTLEIALSLLNPENAKIYRHCNRLNSREGIASDRSAILIADNDVLLNGTEIITEITEKEVKIQLVSGESELNYFIGGDKKLNSLELGSFNIHSTEEAGVFIPVFSSNEDTVYNEARIIDSNGGITAGGVKQPLIQPKLSFLVKQIITALGYTVSESVFDSGFLQYIRVLNGKKTVKYSGMLPDWTVNEFFTELENLFNIAFIVDEYTKTVSVQFKNKYYADASKIFVDEVLDEFTETVDTENKLSYLKSNIGYELIDDEYFKYQKLDKTIVDRAQEIELASYGEIGLYYNNNAFDVSSLKNKIFKSLASDTQYICTVHTDIPFSIPQSKKVNIFRNGMNNRDGMNNLISLDLDISLKIIPAPMRVVDIPVYDGPQTHVDRPGNVLYHMIAPLPVTETDEGDDMDYLLPGSEEDEDYIDIQAVLEGGEESGSGSDAPDGMSIFFYTGRHDIFSEDYSYINTTKKVQYPVGFVDYLCEDDRFGERVLDRMSLRLDSGHGLKSLYDSVPVDTAREYTFKFIHRKKLDAKAIFVFRNKNFVCKQLQYTVGPDGIDPLVKGIFYPIE